ncbi:MAG: hypothetical protein ABSA12_00250 [Verrucomicrobiia bacterium]
MRRIRIIATRLFLGVIGMLVVCWLLIVILHALTPWGTDGPPAW